VTCSVPVLFNDAAACAASAASFPQAPVGTGLTVTATGIALSGAKAGNYSLSTTSATATNARISPATATVTASSATVAYGGAAPSITPGYNGFVNGENTSVLTSPATCSTVYTPTTPVTSSPVATTCSGAAAANYTFTYVNGTVTIQKTGPTLAWNTAPPTSAAYKGTFQVTATTNSGDTLTYSASGACSISGTTVTMTSGTGTCTVTANDAGNSNFASGSLSGSTGATKASATVTLGGLSQPFTGNPIAATATTSPAGLNVTFTYNGSSTLPTAAGAYTVVGTINDPNYAGSAGGTLQITVAVLLQTSPSGLKISVDGAPRQQTPFTTSLSLGGHTITTDITQSPVTGETDTFSSWLNNTTNTTDTNIVTTATTSTDNINIAAAGGYTANFATQYLLTYAASPLVGGTVTATNTATGASIPSGTWLNSNTPVSLSASTNTGYTFGSWTCSPSSSAGCGAGFAVSGSTATANMTGPVTATANFTGTISITTSSSIAAAAGGGYQATLNVKNSGSATASTVSVNIWTLGSATAAGLPLSTTNLAPGATASFTYTFPSSVGTSQQKVIMRYTGTYPGGSFSGSLAVTLP
jgi:hypothetical protein